MGHTYNLEIFLEKSLLEVHINWDWVKAIFNMYWSHRYALSDNINAFLVNSIMKRLQSMCLLIFLRFQITLRLSCFLWAKNLERNTLFSLVVTTKNCFSNNFCISLLIIHCSIEVMRKQKKYYYIWMSSKYCSRQLLLMWIMNFYYQWLLTGLSFWLILTQELTDIILEF